MLNDKIKDIELSIQKLDDLKGFKKIIKEHDKINNELIECQKIVDEYNKLIDDYADNFDDLSNVGDISDDQFNEYFSYLNGVNIFDRGIF